MSSAEAKETERNSLGTMFGALSTFGFSFIMLTIQVGVMMIMNRILLSYIIPAVPAISTFKAPVAIISALFITEVILDTIYN